MAEPSAKLILFDVYRPLLRKCKPPEHNALAAYKNFVPDRLFRKTAPPQGVNADTDNDFLHNHLKYKRFLS